MAPLPEVGFIRPTMKKIQSCHRYMHEELVLKAIPRVVTPST